MNRDATRLAAGAPERPGLAGDLRVVDVPAPVDAGGQAGLGIVSLETVQRRARLQLPGVPVPEAPPGRGASPPCIWTSVLAYADERSTRPAVSPPAWSRTAS